MSMKGGCTVTPASFEFGLQHDNQSPLHTDFEIDHSSGGCQFWLDPC